ncbi:MAG TPA: cysteine--tRNA ligase [Candidatus Binataceae bacterium]|nr:cysteine--tRNA ligase [Candidatus Binataceae bacterium]
MKPFHIFNTLTRTVEEIRPAHPPDVTYYSCGPTVYLPQHLGNLRAYVFVDTFRRALRFNGWNVRHVMNVTDVGHMTSDEDAGEDKIEKTARAQGKSPLEVADFYIAQFKRDCARLNIELPEPPMLSRATDHIDEMQALIRRVLANGFAYVTPSGVYFDVEKWRGPHRMGRLSRQSLDEQQGNRLEHSPDKRSPHDFALWVLNQPHHLMQWESPWGRGYPGWHIECSAMSMKYLGETLDIHSGGLDHIPVHHENEIAQSESATGQPFVRYFVHNAFLVGMEGAKISKSAGKFPVLDDLSKYAIIPLAFRFFCLGAKYRSELAFSIESLNAAQGKLMYLGRFINELPKEAKQASEDSSWAKDYEEQFRQALNDDLHTPNALAVALEMVAKARRDRDLRVWNTLLKFDSVLGLDLAGYQSPQRQPPSLPPEDQELIDERKKARLARDYAKADELKKELLTRGYEIKDDKDGSSQYTRGLNELSRLPDPSS